MQAGENPSQNGYEAFIQDRIQRMNATNDPALKAHYKAEIDQVRLMINAANPNPPKGPGGDTPPPSSAAPSAAPAGPGSPGATPGTAVPAGMPANASINLFSNVAPKGPLTKAQSDALAKQLVYALMKDFGFTKEQAAGIVGNLYHESAGLNPNCNEFVYSGYPVDDPRNFGPPVNNVYGYGWAQWSADRKAAYLAFCKQNGLDPGSPKGNYAFLVHELQTTESGTVAAVKNAKTVEEAVVAFRSVYERAAMPNDDSRLNAAKYILGLL